MSEIPSFARKGAAALDEIKSGTEFISLKDGDIIEVLSLQDASDILSFYQHRIWLDTGNSPIFPCLQTKDCPGCMIGDRPSLRAMLVVKQKGADTESIFPFGIAMFRQLVEIDDAISGLRGAVLRLSRKGSSATNTKYNVINTGRRAESPEEPTIDLLQYIGPSNRNEIINMLVEAKKWDVKSGPTKGDPPFEADADAWKDPKFE